MVIRDSRGKVNTSDSWNSQIITRAGGKDIRLGGHVDISGRGGEGGGGSGGLISSQPHRNSHMVQAYR